MSVSDPVLWAALLEINGINIILSGDNVVVMVLAAVGVVLAISIRQFLAARQVSAVERNEIGA